MKFLTTVLAFSLLATTTKAQEVIKVGEEKTITCSGTYVNEVQHYFSNGQPASKGKTFVDSQNDSLIVYTAYLDNGSSHTVYRYAIAKKDIDTEDDAITVKEAKENGVTFQILYINTKEQQDVVKTERHSSDEMEMEEATNFLKIYFAADKIGAANQWIEKIKAYIK
jgi:hypothetical protein